MANNPIFKKILIKDTELAYPRLNQTFRYNSQEQRSEPCSQTAQGAAWSVSWTMSAEEAKKLYGELKTHYNECKTLDRTLPDFGTVFGMKKLDNGLVSFRAKKNGTNRNGEPNKAPLVIDGEKNDLADKAIWTGSRGTIRVIAFPSKSPQGEGGISLLLDAVQVTVAEYGDASGMDDFDTVETVVNKVESEDPFGLPAAKPAASADFDDEIPF